MGKKYIADNFVKFGGVGEGYLKDDGTTDEVIAIQVSDNTAKIPLRTIGWAASQAATDIVVGNTDDFFVKYDFTLVTYWCGLSDPPTGSSATFDLLKNGVSITSTKATIAASAYNSLTGTQPVLTTTTFLKGDRITPVISSIGSLNTGQSLKVYLEIIKS